MRMRIKIEITALMNPEDPKIDVWSIADHIQTYGIDSSLLAQLQSRKAEVSIEATNAETETDAGAVDDADTQMATIRVWGDKAAPITVPRGLTTEIEVNNAKKARRSSMCRSSAERVGAGTEAAPNGNEEKVEITKGSDRFFLTTMENAKLFIDDKERGHGGETQSTDGGEHEGSDPGP
jgi:hypothetical protein